ncbi:MAG: F0F1 ATP synthase subunit gamma [Methylococcaceae bacterium]|nr:MAG: F0F1 ATP synthase subunit gamma [Methylococcaceae bacterium]
MSESSQTLRHKIDGAVELASVVRTMKALAAASLGQYERAAHSLATYYHTVVLGLVACLRQPGLSMPTADNHAPASAIGAIVFGSDQGLVGQFNDVLADFVLNSLAALPGEKQVWAVGERMHGRLTDAGLPPMGLFSVPHSVAAITPLVGQLLIDSEAQRERAGISEVHVFHHQPDSAALYHPVSQRLLPLDSVWRGELIAHPWPSNNLPEVMGDAAATLHALVREYLFVSLFKACAESLAAENACRLAAMQRAEKNIDELLEDLNRTYHRQRQAAIDEELFDVIAGYESINTAR